MVRMADVEALDALFEYVWSEYGLSDLSDPVIEDARTALERLRREAKKPHPAQLRLPKVGKR